MDKVSEQLAALEETLNKRNQIISGIIETLLALIKEQGELSKRVSVLDNEQDKIIKQLNVISKGQINQNKSIADLRIYIVKLHGYLMLKR
ncbi:hypothetical protein [Endozoicomonas sp. ONNA1]|uniref:hypothetical protein n=1 Tax=Endozoicomonas sp. ONNA1 TaxID=2828740 RepID=UPI00214731C1|nr:hypothetical protein [Endozoicomonas sp. ONNA1]